MLGADMVTVEKAASPSFKTRRWSLTHLQGPFESCQEYDNWVVILRNVNGAIKRYIDLAPQFGIDSIELTGRPGEGGIDLDWLTTYQEFPRYRRKGAVADTIHRRQQVLRLINEWCEAKVLELWIWHHEFHVPRDFYEAYPEIRGIDYPVCLSHPLIPELIAGKIKEFLEAVPGIAGLVLSMNECFGVELLAPEGCRCAQCAGMTVPDRLRMMVDYVRAPLREAGKKLVARTFTNAKYRELMKHTESEHVFQAFSNLPDDVILMSKYCPLDFYGEEYPNDPLIGAFHNPHLVEFTLNREIMGGTWTPNLTPEGIKRRFENAASTKALGVVGRVDSPTHSDDPWLTIDHPNAFNIYCFARLAQDVTTSVDELWEGYLRQRYPAANSSMARAVLAPTEEMGQKLYMTLGAYGLSYAHRIPHVRQAESRLAHFTLAKWREDWLEIDRRIQERDPGIIDDVLREKDEAVELAQQALAAFPDLREGLNELEYLQLQLGLEKSVQAARLWRQISEVFFVARCLEVSTLDDYDRLLQATSSLFDVASEMRRDFGKNAWPTVAGPYRGIGCEEFVVGAHRVLLYRFLQRPLPVFGGRPDDPETVEHYYPRGNVEDLWRVLLLLRGPESDETGEFADFSIEAPLATVDIGERKLQLSRDDGQSLTLPLYYSADSLTLGRGDHRLNLVPPGWEGHRIGLYVAG